MLEDALMAWSRCLLLIPLLLTGAIASASDDDDIRLANEGGIATWWRLADGVSIAAPGYPESSLRERVDACLSVGYTIRPDGSTSDHVIVKRWSNAPTPDAVAWDQFGQAASSALSQWRFAPVGDAAPKPTFTVATFTFVGSEAVPPGLSQQCKVADVRDAVLAARQDAYERGDINQKWLDRLYRETMRQEIYNNAANLCSRSQSTATTCVF